MLIQREGVDGDIIKMDCNLANSDKVWENHIHKSLKGHRGVSQTKEHYLGFKEASISGEHCLPLITGLDSNVIVFLTNIELGENAGLMEMINDVRGKGKG